MSRKDRLYNYMVNKFGISKEMILERVHERVDDVLCKVLEERVFTTNYFERVVLRKIEAMRTNATLTKFYNHEVLKDIIERAVREEIRAELASQLDTRYELEVAIKERGK